MNIAKIVNNQIILSSGLKAEEFARTNLITLMEEKGILIKFNEGKAQWEEFKFQENKIDDSSNTVFTLPCENEICLKDSQNLQDYVLVLKALDEAIRQNIPLKAPGAGGIFLSKNYVRFLPAELFEQCALNTRDTENHFKYLNKNLEDRDALLFLRSLLAYKALTGHFPFEKDDISSRQSDIYDEFFIPVEMYNPEISPELAQAINTGLKIKAALFKRRNRRDFNNSKQEKENQQRIQKALSFDSAEFERLCSNKEIFVKEETEEIKKFRAGQEKIIKAKRFLRRNKNRILAAGAACIIVGWLINGVINESKNRITTKGLTSAQTTQALYTMIHRADVPNLQEIATGSKMKDLVIKVTGFYVNQKQRLEFNPNEGSNTPAQWFFYKKTSKTWTYGISRLQIDGTECRIENTYSTKGQNPARLTEENGQKLKRGDRTAHTARYYFIHQDSARFNVEEVTETVTLEWSGNRWQVKEIEGSMKTIPVKAKELTEDYHSKLESGMSIKEAYQEITAKYPWLPSEEDIHDAAVYLKETYGSYEAEKYLSQQ